MKKVELTDQTIPISALLAVSLLIFQSYLTQPVKPLDWFQSWSVICFAIALPGLALWFLVYLSNKTNKNNPTAAGDSNVVTNPNKEVKLDLPSLGFFVILLTSI